MLEHVLERETREGNPYTKVERVIEPNHVMKGSQCSLVATVIGDGPAGLLVVFGLSDTGKVHEYLGKYFAGGFTVYLLDLPGAHPESRSLGENLPMRHAEDVAYAAEDLRKNVAGNVAVLAHSYGGLVSARAERDGAGLDTLVLLNTPASRDDVLPIQRPGMSIGEHLPNAVLRALNRGFLHINSNDLKKLFHGYEQLGSIGENLAGSDVPVLLAVSEQDAYGHKPSESLPPQKRALQQQLESRQAVTAYMPVDGANHFLNRCRRFDFRQPQLICQDGAFTYVLREINDWTKEPRSGLIVPAA